MTIEQPLRLAVVAAMLQLAMLLLYKIEALCGEGRTCVLCLDIMLGAHWSAALVHNTLHQVKNRTQIECRSTRAKLCDPIFSPTIAQHKLSQRCCLQRLSVTLQSGSQD